MICYRNVEHAHKNWQVPVAASSMYRWCMLGNAWSRYRKWHFKVRQGITQLTARKDNVQAVNLEGLQVCMSWNFQIHAINMWYLVQSETTHDHSYYTHNDCSKITLQSLRMYQHIVEDLDSMVHLELTFLRLALGVMPTITYDLVWLPIRIPLQYYQIARKIKFTWEYNEKN